MNTKIIAFILIVSAALVGCCKCPPARVSPQAVPFANVPPDFFKSLSHTNTPQSYTDLRCTSIFVLLNGRQVSAKFYGLIEPAPTIQTDSGAFDVSFSPHTLRLESQRLVFDKTEVSNITIPVTTYSVLVSNAAVTVTGDGKRVFTKDLAK